MSNKFILINGKHIVRVDDISNVTVTGKEISVQLLSNNFIMNTQFETEQKANEAFNALKDAL